MIFSGFFDVAFFTSFWWGSGDFWKFYHCFVFRFWLYCL